MAAQLSVEAEWMCAGLFRRIGDCDGARDMPDLRIGQEKGQILDCNEEILLQRRPILPRTRCGTCSGPMLYAPRLANGRARLGEETARGAFRFDYPS